MFENRVNKQARRKELAYVRNLLYRKKTDNNRQQKSVIESIWEAIIGHPSDPTLNTGSKKRLEASKLKRKDANLDELEGGYNKEDDNEEDSDLDSLSSNDSDMKIVSFFNLIYIYFSNNFSLGQGTFVF